MFEELSPALEAVLAQGHPGVVVALVGACRRVGTHQVQVLQLLLEVSGYYFKSFLLELTESLVVSLGPRDLMPSEFIDMGK